MLQLDELKKQAKTYLFNLLNEALDPEEFASLDDYDDLPIDTIKKLALRGLSSAERRSIAKTVNPVVGTRYQGKNYGGGKSTYDPSDDRTEDTPKSQSVIKRGRGRPAGSLGAENRAKKNMGGDAGKSLQDLLIGRLKSKVPSKFVRRIKGSATIDNNTDESVKLEELAMGSDISKSGKKVEWIRHAGVLDPVKRHSITVNGEPVHSGFLDHTSAAALYKKHLSS